MEKHKCNLCLRNFANGRALGGHMRSHTMNQYIPTKPKKQYQYEEEEEEEEEKEEKNDHQLSEEMESLPSSSSEEEEEEEEEEERGGGGIEIRNRGLIMCKGFREKQRKRNYLLDPEFSSAVDATAGSVVLQDRESETESSKKSICRRSKRIRKSRISDKREFSGYNMTEAPQPHGEKQGKSPIGSPLVEHEPVSSISDTTPEEDVAYCLMMLSRDKWNEEEEEESEQEKAKETKKDGGYHDSGGAINNHIKVTKTRNRGKFRCETCNKVFRSYQALGGHRASHKRTKVNIKSSAAAAQESAMANAACTVVEEKIHECPVCYRVFSSGQALGGHKRSHFIGGAATATTTTTTTAAANIISIPSKPFSRFGETLIDLNLPAPMDDEDDDDDDDISQIELSAVSDAEFDNPIIRQ